MRGQIAWGKPTIMIGDVKVSSHLQDEFPLSIDEGKEWNDRYPFGVGEQINGFTATTIDISEPVAFGSEMPTPQESWSKQGWSLTFDAKLDKQSYRSMRKLFKFRMPRKTKKRYKKMISKRLCIGVKHLRFNNAMFNNQKKISK